MEAYQKHLTDFDSHLILKNFSKATRSAYGCALRQFFAYRAEQGHVGTFTQAQARSYILYRYDQGLKWQTINGDYSAMYKFYREVLALPWDVEHIPRPRKERSLPPVLSKQEVQKLIEHGAIFKHQVFMSLLYSSIRPADPILHPLKSWQTFGQKQDEEIRSFSPCAGLA